MHNTTFVEIYKKKKGGEGKGETAASPMSEDWCNKLLLLGRRTELKQRRKGIESRQHMRQDSFT